MYHMLIISHFIIYVGLPFFYFIIVFFYYKSLPFAEELSISWRSLKIFPSCIICHSYRDRVMEKYGFWIGFNNGQGVYIVPPPSLLEIILFSLY